MKLRLIVTRKWANGDSTFCSDPQDFINAPIVSHWNYDEVLIVGGEPLLHYIRLINLVQCVKEICKIMGHKIPKFYVSTSASILSDFVIDRVLEVVDGVIVTLRSKEEIENFELCNLHFLSFQERSFLKDKRLQLNILSGVKALLPEDIDLSLWKVENVDWSRFEGEDFRRIEKLW